MASTQGDENQDGNKITWSDEMTRLLLDLITLEKQAGNSRGKSLSEKGKENVLTEFKKEFPLTLNWNKIKNRLDTLKRQYELYRKITFGATGLGVHPRTGSLDAPDHWCKYKIKAYPEASKLRSHPLRFIPLLHVVFRDETVVVEESWQPRRGVNRHAPLVDVSETERTNEEDEREDLMRENEPHHMETEDPDWMSQIPRENSARFSNSEAEPSFASKETSSMHTHEKRSRNRKRKQNPVDSTLDRIATTMEDRNDILEQMANAKSKSQSTNSTEERMDFVVKHVRAVPDLVPMTELYWASLDCLASTQRFMWSKEATCALLQLVILEKQEEKNPTTIFLSGIQKENIFKNINDQLGVDLTWSQVKNRFDSSKKYYRSYKDNPEDPRYQALVLPFVTLLDASFDDRPNA